MVALVDDAGAGHSGPYGVGHVVGGALEGGDGPEEPRRVLRGLEHPGHDVGGVHTEVGRPLVQRDRALVDLPHSVPVDPLPLDVHGLGAPGRGDQVGRLVPRSACFAPRADVSVRGDRPGACDAGGLRLVPPAPHGQFMPGQPGVPPEPVQTGREGVG